MKKLLLTFIFFTSLLNASSINLALAANVSYAIDDLVSAFHKLHPNTTVNVTLGSSGKLTAQIKYGAPYDVFLSANMAYPIAVYKENLTLTKPRVYAKGTLILLSNKPRDFSQGVNIIQSSKIKSIAMANPRTAPYGMATKEFLTNIKLYNKVKSKFVFGESVSQTVAYTARATDIGFIAKSALFSKQMKKFTKGKNWIDLDATLYTPIKQGIVLLKHASTNQDAKAFYDFILSAEAKKIFKKYGYIVQ
jgi:molybdate transport system substrate-binding protein